MGGGSYGFGGLKKQDLLLGQLPEEIALGVLWNTKEDALEPR